MKIFILLLGVIALASNSVECCFTSGGTSVGGGGVRRISSSDVVTAPPTVKEMACQILHHSNIALLAVNPSGVNDGADAESNIRDTCAGWQAQRSSYGTAPGGPVPLKASVLSYILAVANSNEYDGKLQINSIAGASHTSWRSLHYDGTAVDFQVKSGDRNPAYWQDWMRICSFHGARDSFGPGDTGHENHTHCGFAP